MGDYNALSRTDKLRRAYARLAEAPIACEVCGTRVPVGQLTDHVRERCPGPPEVTTASRWVSWRDIVRRGIPKHTVSRWVGSGRLRYQGDEGERRYLLRDVDRLVANRERARALRVSEPPKRKRKPDSLTNAAPLRRPKRMADHLPVATARRLRAYAERVGSIRAAGRELRIPADTLGRALRGENIRKGTRVLIEAQLDAVSTRKRVSDDS